MHINSCCSLKGAYELCVPFEEELDFVFLLNVQSVEESRTRPASPLGLISVVSVSSTLWTRGTPHPHT